MVLDHLWAKKCHNFGEKTIIFHFSKIHIFGCFKGFWRSNWNSKASFMHDILDHNKCPSSKKSAEKCILRKSFFHHSEPTHSLCFLDVRDFNILVLPRYSACSEPAPTTSRLLLWPLSNSLQFIYNLYTIYTLRVTTETRK